MAPPAFGLTAEPAQLQENPNNPVQRQDDSGDGGDGNWWDDIAELIRGWFGGLGDTGDADDTDTPELVPEVDGPGSGRNQFKTIDVQGGQPPPLTLEQQVYEERGRPFGLPLSAKCRTGLLELHLPQECPISGPSKQSRNYGSRSR